MLNRVSPLKCTFFVIDYIIMLTLLNYYNAGSLEKAKKAEEAALHTSAAGEDSSDTSSIDWSSQGQSKKRKVTDEDVAGA